jgi:DNA-binding response OmpR family regulator
MTAHILIVDDDAKIRRMLRRCLEDEGFRVSEATDGESVLRVMGGANVDLMTLDLNLGSTDGLTVAREVRQKYPVPIIMITGKGDVIDRIVGLEVGADDYVAKPFHLREVLARIRAVLRRHESVAGNALTSLQPQEPPLHFDGWMLDLQRRELTAADGSLCPLTSGEFDLLALFVARPNHVLTREQIMDLLKGNDLGPFDRSIDNQIARLRKKVEADPADPRIIKTVRGAGYSFTARVTTA